MKFNTVSMVKHPLEQVWNLMRDDLPKLADHMEDIESIRVESSRQGEGVHQLVNIWQASVQLPFDVASHLGADLFCWTDHAEWHEAEHQCRWRIEHKRFGEHFDCAGVTQFQRAMGGRGTRVTFSGSIELRLSNMPKVLGMLEDPTLKMVESMISKLIPKNFQKIASAVDSHLSAR